MLLTPTIVIVWGCIYSLNSEARLQRKLAVAATSNKATDIVLAVAESTNEESLCASIGSGWFPVAHSRARMVRGADCTRSTRLITSIRPYVEAAKYWIRAGFDP